MKYPIDLNSKYLWLSDYEKKGIPLPKNYWLFNGKVIPRK